MSERRDQRLDGVSAGPGLGNPLGVMLGAVDPGARRMQRLAAWPNLPETGWPRSHDTHEHRLTVGAFVPGVGVAEDPVTGSANALTAAMLPAQGRLPGRGGRCVANQGCELARDARVERLVMGKRCGSGGLVQAVIVCKIAW